MPCRQSNHIIALSSFDGITFQDRTITELAALYFNCLVFSISLKLKSANTNFRRGAPVLRAAVSSSVSPAVPLVSIEKRRRGGCEGKARDCETLLVKRYNVSRPAVFVPVGDRNRLLVINILSREAIYCMHACASCGDQDRGKEGGAGRGETRKNSATFRRNHFYGASKADLPTHRLRLI